MGVHVTIELDEEVKAAAEASAERRGLNLSEMVAEALRNQAEAEAEWIAKVQEGIDAGDRGELISHEEVVAEVEARRREFEQMAGS